MGGMILTLDAALRAASLVLLFALFCHPRERGGLLPLGAAAAGYGAALLAVHKLLIGRFNFLFFVRDVLHRGMSYQELDFVSTSVLACLVGAMVCGGAAALLLRQPFSMTAPRKPAALACVCILGLGAAAVYYTAFTGQEQISLNEVCTGMDPESEERSSESLDYVELYNNGFLPCSLYGLYLSDRADNLQKLALPAVTIPAGECYLVPLGDGSFSLRREGGETVCLSDRSGRILDSVETECLTSGLCLGRQEDGTGSWAVLSPTPGQLNVAARCQLAAPTLSAPSGFYDAPFWLELQSDYSVYYTLDSSTPTRESTLYREPVYVYDKSPEENQYRNIPSLVEKWWEKDTYNPPVEKLFVLRAVAMDDAGNTSPVVTAVFGIGLDAFRDHPVVSLVSDPEGFFGDEGICVTGPDYDQWYYDGMEGRAPAFNTQQRGRDWERETNFTWISGDTVLSQEVGLRLQGASARNNTPLKRFAIFSRTEYSGSSLLDLELIPGLRSHSLVTRRGLANTIGIEFGKTRNVAYQNYQLVSVFLDGEFWYDAPILEKYDDLYFSQHYGIPEDNLILIKGSTLEEGTEEDRLLQQEVYTFLETNDLSDPERYAAFCEMVDMQSYLDFMCLNLYMDNLDFNERKNIVWWRSREVVPGSPYEDGKWRFGLYDMDYLDWADASYYGAAHTYEKDSFLLGRTNGGPVIEQPILSSLLQNRIFRRQFAMTFLDIANVTFSPENVDRVLDTYIFGVGDYYRNFFANRADYILPFMAEHMELTGTLETVSVTVNDPLGGTIHLNTTDLPLESGSWQGSYYSDLEITAAAQAAPGYVFKGWTGSAQAQTETITVPVEEGGIELHAVFEKMG